MSKIHKKGEKTERKYKGRERERLKIRSYSE